MVNVASMRCTSTTLRLRFAMRYEPIDLLHLLDALQLLCDFVLFLDALRFLGALIRL